MVLPGAPKFRTEPRVALVHEWLITIGGSELTLAQLRKIFPHADVFALVDKLGERDRSFLGLGHTRTSFLQAIPQIEKRYRALLPLFPAAVRSLDVSDYDIVISSSHAVAKGVRTGPGQLHVCLCYSPMRYAWDLREQYLRESGNDRGARGVLARALLGRLRRWDRANSDDVDSFVAISEYIAGRIQRAYDRSATVIYPPVDTLFYTPGAVQSREEYYVTASRFVPYKRVDLIAAAFRELPDKRLVVVGTGPDEAKVRAAAGPNVELVGHVARETLRELLRGAAGFVFAAEEDFGIAPVEAQACGTPVLAFGRGGSVETVVTADDPERRTGLLFPEQTKECIVAAVHAFSTQNFSRVACRVNAERFSEERFRAEFLGHVQNSWANHQPRQSARAR
jgi:glycosyltransferase involved in cell wall biosynthesis